MIATRIGLLFVLLLTVAGLSGCGSDGPGATADESPDEGPSLGDLALPDMATDDLPDAEPLSDAGTPSPDTTPDQAPDQSPDRATDATPDSGPDAPGPDEGHGPDTPAGDTTQPDHSTPDADDAGTASDPDAAMPLGALPICINEFMADNDTTLNVDENFPDWIELFNSTAEDVLLDGWWLSDDRDEPDKHEMTGGLVVPAGNAIVLYADNMPELGDDHLSFSLAVESEEIVLTAPDGRTAIVHFGPLTDDVSAARETDCCTEPDCWVYRFAGSPGMTNGIPEMASVTLFEPESEWWIYDEGVAADAYWTEPDFDDSAWWSGVAPLGYGDAHIATTVDYGPDESAKYITTYFRTTFEATDIDALDQLVVQLLRDDGAAVYLNGIEVARSNLPAEDLRYATLATATAGDSDETTYHSFIVPDEIRLEALREGLNTLAVEVHQASPTSSDQGMDVSVVGQFVIPADPVAPPEGEYTLVIEEVEGFDDPSAWLFETDIIHQIDLEIPPESWAALEAYPYDYQPASVTIDGQIVGSIGVRLRGKYGSFRYINEKPKLKLDFNRFVPGQRFYGIESLSLNNSVVDCGYLKEAIGYRVFSDVGLPTPRLAFTNVTLNGADYGLYQIVDSQDDVWLGRHFEDPTGNLYDGKYAFEWPFIWIGFVDFWPGMDSLFQLEEGVDVGLADVRSITRVNQDFGGTNAFYDEMAVYLDWEQWHRHIAAEYWTGHLDGYWLNTNNYRVYFEPTDGLAEFITWDLDYAFIYDYDWGSDWNRPASWIADHCREHSVCMENQRATAEAITALIDPVAIEAYFDELLTLIRERALNDPRRECGTSSVNSYQNALRTWIQTRNDDMASFWGF